MVDINPRTPEGGKNRGRDVTPEVSASSEIPWGWSDETACTPALRPCCNLRESDEVTRNSSDASWGGH